MNNLDVEATNTDFKPVFIEWPNKSYISVLSSITAT